MCAFAQLFAHIVSRMVEKVHEMCAFWRALFGELGLNRPDFAQKKSSGVFFS
jgi:hypothetical protein